MAEPQKLGDILSQQNAIGKCENCGFGPKMWDAKKQGYANWCQRCIAVYRRKEALRSRDAERLIAHLVELRYAEAHLDDLRPFIIKEQLLGLEYGQDVFMYGKAGTGKTYAMAALIRYYVCEGYECNRFNFDDFCVQVRSTFSANSKLSEWDLIEPLKQVDKLFIDDLGLSNEETQFTYRTLYSILNKRQERMLPTFITTNKTVEQVGWTFDARIASRLQTALIIEMTGPDRRKILGKG